MYAPQIHARQNKLLQAVPADRKPIAERRPAEGMLADEVFNARPSVAASFAEAALMCAVLEDAIDCFQKQFVCATRHAKHLGREAEQWLFSDDPHWPFSFLSICGVLELCPQYIRQGLKRWYDGGQESSHKKSADEMTAEQRTAGDVF
jgi:hypothetical protein